MILEICANSYQSAMNAEKAGAHRIELCSELAVGGITPSYGLIKRVMQDISIPVHVLIRPRSGNFTYSKEEFEIMKEDILLFRKLGVSGIVSGILADNNRVIDYGRTQELVAISDQMSFTFHRAFDWVNQPVDAALALQKIGVDRILSSGQQTSAEKGISLMKKLKDEINIKILPGGGINAQNAHLFKEAGFDEIHCSASKQIQTIDPPKISMNSSKLFDEIILSYSDINTIKNILTQLHE